VFPRLIELTKAGVLYFLDEAIFSGSTNQRRVWAMPGSARPTLEATRFNFKAIAAVATIDCNGRVVAHSAYEKSVDTEKFICYLKLLR
jgi:hypothetical protein